MSSPILRMLFDAQDGVCAGCGHQMLHPGLRREPVSDPLAFPSVDHVTPRSKGGRDDRTNIVAMHLRCNNRKADRDPTGCEMIWREVVSARLGSEYSFVLSLISTSVHKQATLADIWPR